MPCAMGEVSPRLRRPWPASTSLLPTSQAVSASSSPRRSRRTGSHRSGRRSTRSSAELAAVAGVEHAVALSSGTAALHLALVVLGIGAGDEVACSGFTFAASANAIIYTGATPFFVDAEAGDLDDRPRPARPARSSSDERPARVFARWSPSTSTASAATTTRCASSASSEDVVLVQDAAESLGSTYRGAPAGGQGALAAFSFNGNKIITTSGGGMLVSANGDWVEHARKLSTQAREPVAALRARRDRLQLPAVSNVLAALGRAQLETLPERVATRRRLRDRYRELLDVPGIAFMPEAAYGTTNAWLTCIVVDPDVVRRRPGGDPARARGRGHRGAAALEADAPAAALRRARRVRRRRVGAALRARALPAERVGADRRTSRIAWSLPCSGHAGANRSRVWLQPDTRSRPPKQVSG